MQCGVHFPSVGWLQVHAVDEVIGLLRGQGSGFLQLVANEPETTADHEQQQSGDDEAERQRKDRAWRRRRGMILSIKEQELDGDRSVRFSYPTPGLDVLPLLQRVLRWGRRRCRPGSWRL